MHNKGGGGVVIYVDNILRFKILDDMTIVVDKLFECLTMCMEKSKNIIISCIYRAPGTSIESFTEFISKNYQTQPDYNPLSSTTS